MRVRITAAGYNQATIEAADGTPLPAVESAVITLRGGEINRAELTIACFDLTAEAEATMLICFAGEPPRAVRRIEFADGTVWPPV
jgi:hypothetical protein